MNNWRRPSTLHELLEELKDADSVPETPDGIVIFPPENANEEVTDEDSGDEEAVSIGNLPCSQLRAPAEVCYDDSEYEYEYSEDDLSPPLAVIIAKKSKHDTGVIRSPRKRPDNFSWIQKDLDRNPDDDDDDDDEWKSTTGPTTREMTPLQFFELFFDDQVTNMILNHTNNYAAQKSRIGDITLAELKRFLGVLLLSGFVCLPRRCMYWENFRDARNELVSDAISRDRFTYIMTNLHCCDNGDLRKDDKYSKVRPLFAALNDKFITYAPFEENHSVDEAMVPYYGRHGCKQSIRGKPIRWGYKFWVAATRLGYALWFLPYEGASTVISEAYKEMGLGASVILRYADVLRSNWKDSPFHLYFDRFFCSIPLLCELKARGLKGTGTVRENRTGNCPLPSCAEIKKQERGSFHYRSDRDNNIVICKWRDNNAVTIIASNHGSVRPLSRVKRYSQKEKKYVDVDRPYVVGTHNTYTKGVDRLERNVSLLRTSIRGKKWYFPLICQCVDMAEQNAWQLHRIAGGKLDRLGFRRAVARNLLLSSSSSSSSETTLCKKTEKGGPPPSSSSSAKAPRHLNEHSRYDRLDHLVIYQEERTRCAVCRKKGKSKCEKCNVVLHPRDCFKFYHTM